jgi:hypothetical protein
VVAFRLFVELGVLRALNTTWAWGRSMDDRMTSHPEHRTTQCGATTGNELGIVILRGATATRRICQQRTGHVRHVFGRSFAAYLPLQDDILHDHKLKFIGRGSVKRP